MASPNHLHRKVSLVLSCGREQHLLIRHFSFLVSTAHPLQLLQLVFHGHVQWPAGCSIQDELFMSFEQLLSLADRKGVQYDR